MRHRRLLPAVLTAALAASGCSLLGGDDPDPAEPARAFLTAWQAGDVAAAGAATDDPAGATTALTAFGKAVGGRGTLALGPVTETDGTATAAYTAEWALPAVATPWRYDGSLQLAKAEDAWTVRWAPATCTRSSPPARR